jgi:hypothetical protein
MNDTRDDATSDLKRIDPVLHDRFAGLSRTPEANQLLQHIILSTDDTRSAVVVGVPRRRRSLRWITAAAAVAALLVGVVFLQLPQAQVAGAVEFKEEGDYIEAIIVDPQATKAELESAFAAHGFSIDVQLLPTSPSLEGKVLTTMEDPTAQKHSIRTIYQTGACYTGGGGFRCPVGVKIPLDFEGHAVIGIGRLAADGELYVQGNNNPFYPGEMLHCSDLPGKTVAEALPILKGLGVTALWRSADQAIDDVNGIDPNLIQDQFVDADGSTIANGETYIWVSPKNNYPDGEDCNAYG